MKVYHALGMTGMIAFLNRTEGKGQFRLVAEVQSRAGWTTEANLGHAFERTNTIDRNWCDNTGVKPVYPHCRSTSCGDIIEIDGVHYIVAPVGFDVVPKPEVVF